MTPLRSLASDNYAGVHPEVLAAIAAANEGHARAYGADEHTARVRELFRRHLGPDADAHLVLNGTGANVLAIAAVTRPWEAVICPATAHLNVDECGAPEAVAGRKLLAVPTPDGKLTPELAEPLIARVGDEHAVQPRVISISQSSELGTVYTVAEVAALAELAHSRGLLLHVDGARLCNAAAALDAGLGDITAGAGVDLLSFGGTKLGLLLGEAVVFLRPGLGEGFAFTRKQGMQLASKMRFIAAQFEALLAGDLWLRNAAHANAMAARLAAAVGAVPGVRITRPVDANAVFAIPPAGSSARLAEHTPFYVWDEATGEVRWMCAWDTAEDDVDAFAAAVAEAAAASTA